MMPNRSKPPHNATLPYHFWNGLSQDEDQILQVTRRFS